MEELMMFKENVPYSIFFWA